MDNLINEVTGSEGVVNRDIIDVDYTIAINTINAFDNEKYLGKSLDHKKLNVKEMNLNQLEEKAKLIINVIVDLDKVEMKKKMSNDYLRFACEEIYGEEDKSDSAEQEEGYYATALWNNRKGIENRLFDILIEEAHIQYYKLAVEHYGLDHHVADELKSEIASFLNRYDN